MDRVGDKMFEGIVRMYDEDVHINTDTKEGYARVIERIDPLLCKMASKTYMPGYNFDDIKQELIVIAVEGVNAFDPKKNVKLSTFLHIHLRNKLISKIKSVNKLSNDAFSLSENMQKNPICSCGGKIISDEYIEEETGKVKCGHSCEVCSKNYSYPHRRSREELIFSGMPRVNPNDGEEYADFQSSLSNSSGLYSNDRTSYDDVELELLIDKLSEAIDEKTSIILRKVCLEGFSIKDAAESVGLTGWAASMRLKKLDRFKILKDLLD
jgi:RNA polymerase sigma factor (sigma-70 family)